MHEQYDRTDSLKILFLFLHSVIRPVKITERKHFFINIYETHLHVFLKCIRLEYLSFRQAQSACCQTRDSDRKLKSYVNTK